MIRKASDPREPRKHFLLIAGIPGIGKSTLALSAPRPLFIDCDLNLDKVDPAHRMSDYIRPGNYQEILDDLKNADLSDYETIIIDTGGAMIDFMKRWLISNNSKNARRDGQLSLQGYGALKNEFKRLGNYVIIELKKHLVMVCHSVEKKVKDDFVYRLDIEGSSDNSAWKTSDMAAFYHVNGNSRVLMFTPTEDHHAKGAYGISGPQVVPELTPGIKNDYITRLFQRAEKFNEKEDDQILAYITLMTEIKEMIAGADDLESINGILDQFGSINWLYEARKEAWTIFKERAETLGYKYNREAKVFEGVPSGK